MMKYSTVVSFISPLKSGSGKDLQQNLWEEQREDVQRRLEERREQETLRKEREQVIQGENEAFFKEVHTGVCVEDRHVLEEEKNKGTMEVKFDFDNVEIACDGERESDIMIGKGGSTISRHLVPSKAVSSEVMMEMCTPAPRRQQNHIWAPRTQNCETPVSIMEFSTPSLKRTAAGPQPVCFTPATLLSSSRHLPHQLRMNLCTPAVRHNSGTSRQEQMMELCTPARPTLIQTTGTSPCASSFDRLRLPSEMELATPAPPSKMILPVMEVTFSSALPA